MVIYAYANPTFVGENFFVRAVCVVVLTLLQCVCLNVFLYGLSVIPFTYLLSFFFTSHSTAQNVMILVYILGGQQRMHSLD